MPSPPPFSRRIFSHVINSPPRAPRCIARPRPLARHSVPPPTRRRASSGAPTSSACLLPGLPPSRAWRRVLSAPLRWSRWGVGLGRDASSATTPAAMAAPSTGSRSRTAENVRRFAPVGDVHETENAAGALPRLRGVVFDVDGTLCEPQTYMFQQMRAALGIDRSTDILDHVYALPAAAQAAAMERIRGIEREAMRAQVAQPGLGALMRFLDGAGLPKAICTRNFDTPVAHLLDKFLAGHAFWPIVTRDFRPPKPHPAGILHIAESWQLDGAAGLIMVGDSLDDMTAGHRAGAATVLLVNDVNVHLTDHPHTDLCIDRLDDLIPVLQRGFVGTIDAEH